MVNENMWPVGISYIPKTQPENLIAQGIYTVKEPLLWLGWGGGISEIKVRAGGNDWQRHWPVTPSMQLEKENAWTYHDLIRRMNVL